MADIETPDDLLLLREAASLVNRHPNSLRNWNGRKDNSLKFYRDYTKPNNPIYVSKKQVLQMAGFVENEFNRSQQTLHGSLGMYSEPVPSAPPQNELLSSLLAAKDEMIALLKSQISNQNDDIRGLKNRRDELEHRVEQLQRELLSQPRALLNPYTGDGVPIPSFPAPPDWD